MTIEERFIQKTFYQSLIKDSEYHPVQTLADMFLEEQNKDVYDLSDIRFAQGEIYYHHKDYEAAIFKWEQVGNDLQPWAKKNMADAYYKLDLLSTAEALYQSIETKNPVLKMEINLQLFSMYSSEKQYKKAETAIRTALTTNPDYPNVATIAISFFEEQKDWISAINTAMNKYIRTTNNEWVERILHYIHKGFTQTISPSVFQKFLHKLLQTDIQQFENISITLWRSYQSDRNYLKLLKELNEIFIYIGVDERDDWYGLVKQYEDTYFNLIKGNYRISEIKEIVPDLLAVWLKISQKSPLLAAAAVLAWNEIFPLSISSKILTEAESLILNGKSDNHVLDELEELYTSIIQWTKKENLTVNAQLTWILEQLKERNLQNVLLLSSSDEKKLQLIHQITQEKLFHQILDSVVLLKPGEEKEIREIRCNNQRMYVDYKSPSQFLNRHQLAILHVPIDLKNEQWDVYNTLYLADKLLYYFPPNTTLDEQVFEELSFVKSYVRNIPIHFVVHEDESNDKQNCLMKQLGVHFPHSNIYLINNQSEEQTLTLFIQTISTNDQRLLEERLEKRLFFMRKLIADLVKQRLENENGMKDHIQQKETLLSKVTAEVAEINQLKDDKLETIQHSYHLIRQELISYLKDEIPTLLHKCSNIIDNHFDSKTFEQQVNEEINKKLKEFLNAFVLKKCKSFLNDWLKICESDFNECKNKLIISEKKVKKLLNLQDLSLQPEIKLLDDWGRDIDRLCSSIQYEEINIFNRNTFSHLFIKGAGRLFSAIQSDHWKKRMKQYIETEDFEELTNYIIQQFFLPFTLFEKGIERDIAYFFKKPLEHLQTIQKSLEEWLNDKKEELNDIKNHPETYRDPLTLFELRLRQFEWAEKVGKGIQYLY